MNVTVCAEYDQMTWKTIARRTYALSGYEQLPPWTETGLYNVRGCRRMVEDGKGTMVTKRRVWKDGGKKQVTEELRFRT